MNLIRTLASVSVALLASRADAQGRISGTVYDSLSTRAPLANATVVLVERSRYTTTDARGHFQIDSVPDGHYTIGFMHPVLDSLDLTAPVVGVDVAGGRRMTVELFTPSPAAAYARICPGTNDIETGVVIGRVRDVDDQSPLEAATISTEWTEFTLTAGRIGNHRVRAAAQTNRDGRYVLCGVPATVPLDVHAELAGFAAGPTPVSLDDRLIGRLYFAISRRDSAARTMAPGDTSTVVTRTSGTASLRGRVVGDGGRAIKDALVDVVGTLRSTRTDASGAFRLDHIAAGTRAIEVRSIGLVPMTAPMDFATGASRDTILSITQQAQTLKAVAVLGRSGRVGGLSLMEHEGFDARRRMGLGAFMTEEDLGRHGYSDLISILQHLRGVTIEWSSSGRTGGIAEPMPYLLGIGNTQGSVHCIPNFFLDNAPFQIREAADFSDLSAMVPPIYIKGIEVYSNPGSMPVQYDLTSSTGCGSIVIWTR